MKRRTTQKLLPGGGGRPRQFHIDESTGKMIAQLALYGLTNREIALVFGISEATLSRRLREHAEAETNGGEGILQAIQRARSCADAEVVHALFRRATGFRLGKMYFPPDTAACSLWLRNRCPDKWRDRTETSVEVKKAPPLLNIVIENDGTPKK